MESALLAREGVGKTPSRGLVTETQTAHGVNSTNKLLQEGDEPLFLHCTHSFVVLCSVYYGAESESYIWDHFSVSARKPCQELGALPSAEAVDST